MKDFTLYPEALALKELGFDEPCIASYTQSIRFNIYEQSGLHWNTITNDGYIKEYPKACTAPLYQQAFRWFREKFNLEYQIIKSANGNYSAVIHLNTREYLDKILTLSNACVAEVVDCYSYEEAELACLRKLIEIVKNKSI
jgi:hypothetical protein